MICPAGLITHGDTGRCLLILRIGVDHHCFSLVNREYVKKEFSHAARKWKQTQLQVYYFAHDGFVNLVL